MAAQARGVRSAAALPRHTWQLLPAPAKPRFAAAGSPSPTDSTHLASSLTCKQKTTIGRAVRKLGCALTLSSLQGFQR